MTMSDNSPRAYANVYLYILSTNNNNSNNSRVCRSCPRRRDRRTNELRFVLVKCFLLYVHNIILAMFSRLQVTINFVSFFLFTCNYYRFSVSSTPFLFSFFPFFRSTSSFHCLHSQFVSFLLSTCTRSVWSRFLSSWISLSVIFIYQHLRALIPSASFLSHSYTWTQASCTSAVPSCFCIRGLANLYK